MIEAVLLPGGKPGVYEMLQGLAPSKILKAAKGLIEAAGTTLALLGLPTTNAGGITVAKYMAARILAIKDADAATAALAAAEAKELKEAEDRASIELLLAQRMASVSRPPESSTTSTATGKTATPQAEGGPPPKRPIISLARWAPQPAVSTEHRELIDILQGGARPDLKKGNFALSSGSPLQDVARSIHPGLLTGEPVSYAALVDVAEVLVGESRGLHPDRMALLTGTKDVLTKSKRTVNEHSQRVVKPSAAAVEFVLSTVAGLAAEGGGGPAVYLHLAFVASVVGEISIAETPGDYMTLDATMRTAADACGADMTALIDLYDKTGPQYRAVHSAVIEEPARHRSVRAAAMARLVASDRKAHADRTGSGPRGGESRTAQHHQPRGGRNPTNGGGQGVSNTNGWGHHHDGSWGHNSSPPWYHPNTQGGYQGGQSWHQESGASSASPFGGAGERGYGRGGGGPGDGSKPRGGAGGAGHAAQGRGGFALSPVAKTCRDFNGAKGCKREVCYFAHVCTVCAAPNNGHARVNCPAIPKDSSDDGRDGGR
jgi:hypothetical protein